jgi:hypothetical protein
VRRACKILVGKPEKREPLPRVWLRWKGKIKMERGDNLD